MIAAFSHVVVRIVHEELCFTALQFIIGWLVCRFAVCCIFQR